MLLETFLTQVLLHLQHDSNNPAPTYCTSSGSRTTYEWIDNVELGGIY